MKVLTSTVARILFAIPFAVFGLFHFLNGNAMAGFLPSWLPGGVVWIYLTGAALILGAVSLIIQKHVKWAALGIAAFLALTILTIWLPSLGNESMRQTAITSALKDLGLLAGSLLFAGLYSERKA
jgi:putative oxidoreductase